jgi:hypothetical protein
MSEEKRQVRPWDLFNKNMNRAPSEVREERLSICRSCPFFIKHTEQCKKCLCIMPQKTKLADAFCPEHKWGQYVIQEKDVSFKESSEQDPEDE